MVVDIVTRGGAASPSVTDGVKGGRDAERGTLRPYRVIVMFAVQSEGIDPTTIGAGFGRDLHSRVDGPAHEARHHNRAQLQIPDGVLKLIDGFCGRVHRNGSDGNQAV